MNRISIVVPCYDEAHRFDADAFDHALAENPGLEFLFVDDGSRDDTLQLLRKFEQQSELRRDGRVRVMGLARNQGKSHAVRAGMIDAFSTDALYCGYWDADLATPLDEIPRFMEVLEGNHSLDLVIGSRVKLLGRSIQRDPLRHYLGRVAATVASMLLQLPVYDTQCGAKIFRNTPAMKQLFVEPLNSGWVFDVEVIARLIRYRRDAKLPSAEHAIYELPLQQWHDVAGSKVHVGDYLRALVEVINVWRRFLRG